MKEQRYILENCTAFEPKDIFDCGQCFRWNEEENKSYTGIFKNNVLNVKKENEKIIFQGICERRYKRNMWRLFWFKNRLWRDKKEIIKNRYTFKRKCRIWKRHKNFKTRPMGNHYIFHNFCK